MMNGKKPVVAKGEVMKKENALAEHVEARLLNKDYGFRCLHYSVSEASGSLRIFVLNKHGKEGSVRV